MKRAWFTAFGIALLAGMFLGPWATRLSAQAGGYGAPPPGYDYPYSYSSTPAEGAMNGMSNVISSKGNYNLSTSQAAINMTQAQSNEIQNHLQYENTYFEMRKQNQAYQASQRGPRPTEEQIARMARDAAPKPLSPGEVDSRNGKANWPDVLQLDEFAAERATMDQLLAKKATHGSLGFQDQMTARKTIESMFQELKSQISDIPSQQYLASRNFLRSLIYDTAHTDL